MTDLVVCIGEGKGTWGHVQKVIEDMEWGSIYVVTNKFGAEKFTSKKKFEFILIDENKRLTELVEDIRKQIHGKIKDFEVGVNFISGNGKEHMAAMSALLKEGFGIRLVALTFDGVKEL
jgi:hypothetical protein